MSVKGKRKIFVGPADTANPHPLAVEGLAVDAIVPGSIVKRVAGGLETTDKASTVFDSEAIVAMEYGDHTDQDVDTPYVIGDVALAAQARSGEFWNVLVVAAAVLLKGTALSSNGDGSLKIAVADGTEQILFYSDEVVTVAAGGALVTVRKA